MGRNTLICHILDGTKEVGTKKARTHDESVKAMQRAWIIQRDAIITDKKGFNHIYLDIRESDGVYRLKKDNLKDVNGDPIDKCGQCGGKISIDSQSVRTLVAKNIITSFWGRDNSYVLLLMIVGIIALIAVGATFYLVGELNKTNQILQKYLQPAPNVVTSSNFIIGFIGVYS